MTVNYNKLWKKLIDLDMSRTQMRLKAGISTKQLAKIDEAYELFENKRDGVIKVAVEC